MTSEKAGLMAIVFTLIQLVCITGVILCENKTIDWCIIGFQVLMILVQMLIVIFDAQKNKHKVKIRY